MTQWENGMWETWPSAAAWRPELKLASPQSPKGLWVPALSEKEQEEAELPQEARTLLGVETADDCQVLEARSGLPGISLWRKPYPKPSEMLRELQRARQLFQRLQAEDRMPLLQAAAESEDCVFLGEVLEVGAHLDKYSFLSIEDFQAEAKQELLALGLEERVVEQCFDFTQYAAIRLGWDHLYISDRTGLYVHRRDDHIQTLEQAPDQTPSASEQVMERDPAERSQQERDENLEMGGLI